MTKERFIRRCIELAKKGYGNTGSNPLVGAVIVHKGKIIAEGFHRKYGEAHAEVNAVNKVKDKSILKECEIYVSLEPCAHFGKTPPCANLIVESGFKKVYVGMLDPHEKVAGKGIKIIQDAGIEVEYGICEDECRLLNEVFIKNHLDKMPFVILKWAESIDGFIDIDRKNNEKGVHWITAPETRLFTHQLRAKHDAILIGKNTLFTDNPSLTTRDVHGSNPKRVIIGDNITYDSGTKIFNDDTEAFIYNTQENRKIKNVSWIKMEAPLNVNDILKDLFTKGICSILIEGGRNTLQQFIDQNNWNKSFVLKGETPIINGLLAPQIDGSYLSEIHKLGKDSIKIYRNA